MQANSTDLLNLTVIDSPRRSWLLRFWIVGCLLATSFCVFKGLEASSSSTRPTTRQTTVTKEVRRQTRMDEIKEGDVVLARDEFGDTVAPKKVTRVFHRTSDHLRVLTFESRDGTRQTVKTTDEHPFALADSLDFLPAGKLRIGQEVPGPKGKRQTLVESLREEHPEGIPVFNFEVEGFHTYFVAAADTSAFLVHNTCSVDDIARSAATPKHGPMSHAGHNLQKHSVRPNSPLLGNIKGSPKQINERAQEMVEEILTNPATTTKPRMHPRFGSVLDITGPNGVGIRVDATTGEFIHFLGI